MKHVGTSANAADILPKGLIRAPFGAATLTNSAVATETIVARWGIPAYTLTAGDQLNVEHTSQVSSTATLAYKIRFGPLGTVADPVLCTFATSAAGVANAWQFMDALISILTATTATAGGSSMLGNGVVGVATAAFAAAAVNLTVANFLSVTVVQSIAQTCTSRGAKLGF